MGINPEHFLQELAENLQTRDGIKAQVLGDTKEGRRVREEAEKARDRALEINPRAPEGATPCPEESRQAR